MAFDGDLEPCLSKKKSLKRYQTPTQNRTKVLKRHITNYS